MANEFLLEMKDVHKSFYGAEVLHGINMNVRVGEIHGLVGENGAGKSTMMSILGGVYGFDSGSMTIHGQDYKPTAPGDATNVGISFIHQELSLFSKLSVAENLFIDGFPKKGIQIDKKLINEKAKKYIDAFGLDITPKTKVETLPMGIRQIIEICKALEKNSKIMIFDEPTTSLSTKEKTELFDTMKRLKSEGVSIIFISHILEDVLELCDRITVIRDGNSIGTCETNELDKKTMIKMMVGRDLNQIYPTIEKKIGAPVYEAKDFVREGAQTPVSLTLKEGQIVGLFGLMGAGRTELLRSLFGVDSYESGTVSIHGETLKKISPSACIDRRMAFVTEDRRNEGLVMMKTINENIVVVILKNILKSFGVINRAQEKQIAKDSVKKFGVKTSNPAVQFVSNLSGGNQQKVVIAKWMASDPKIFFMDEPTRGVDVGAKYEIYTYINQLAKDGCAILFVSSEMEELMGICDNILVMHSNQIVADFARGEYDQEKMLQKALEGGENCGA